MVRGSLIIFKFSILLVPKFRIRVDDSTSVGKNQKKNTIRLTNKERMRKYVKKKKTLNNNSFY